MVKVCSQERCPVWSDGGRVPRVSRRPSLLYCFALLSPQNALEVWAPMLEQPQSRRHRLFIAACRLASLCERGPDAGPWGPPTRRPPRSFLCRSEE